MSRNFNEEESFVIEYQSPNNKWITVFEDDGETGHMYLGSLSDNGELDEIVDDLWIYNQIDPPIEDFEEVFIIWSDDSNRTGLIVEGQCLGIFDLCSKRKLKAPREKNIIDSIEIEVWEKGIKDNEGELLKLCDE